LPLHRQTRAVVGPGRAISDAKSGCAGVAQSPLAMILESKFVPAWWLPGPHLQTIWPTLLRPRPALRLRRQRLELPDGDFLDLSRNGLENAPRVLVLHGLEGNLRSHYAVGLLYMFWFSWSLRHVTGGGLVREVAGRGR